MKKRIPIILALAVVLALTAGTASAAGITDKGVKLGFNLANLTTDESGLDLTSKFGIAAGGFVTFSLTEMFAIQPEILFMQKGAKWDFSESGVSGYYKFNITTIDIPVLVKVYIPVQGAAFRPNVYAGPYLGLKVSGKIAYKFDYEGETEKGSEDMEGIKGTDFGAVFGAGADFAMGAGKVLFDIRYGMSLSTISDEGDTTKHGVFTLLIGYSF